MSETAAEDVRRPAGQELARRLAEVQDCARRVARGDAGLARRGDMDPDDVAQDIALQYCKRLTEPISLLGWAATATRCRLVDLAERRDSSRSTTTSCSHVDAAERVASHMRSVESQHGAVPHQQQLLNKQMWIHNEPLSGRSSDHVDQEIMEAEERYATWQHAAYPSLQTALAAAYQVLADALAWREPRPDIPRDLTDYITAVDVADYIPHLDREVHRLGELLRTLESRFAPCLAQAQPPREGLADIGSGVGLLEPLDATTKHVSDSDFADGIVVKVDPAGALLEIGYPADGAIPAGELSIKHDVDPSEVVSLGDAVETLVVDQRDNSGRPILSKKRAKVERVWSAIKKIKEEGGAITGTVVEVVKGGLILNVGVRGFLPASEIEMRKVSSLEEYVGRRLSAMILQLDHHRKAVVLSRKAWLKENPIEQRRPIVAFIFAHWPNQIAAGRVTKLIPSGAFVSLGMGVEGWIHLSELAGRSVEDPKQIVHVGDDIFVKILDMDPDKARISLSLKQANDAALVREFDPTLYGMTVEFDERGNYKYPEGFDAVTKEWLEGQGEQRENWEKRYTSAHTKWEAHRAQVQRAAINDTAFPSRAKRAGRKEHRVPTRHPRTRRGRPGGSDRASGRGPSRASVVAPAVSALLTQ